MIVLDASVLIAHLNEGEAHHERAGELLLGSTDERLGASVITLAETLVGPARAHRLDEAHGLVLGELAVEPIGLGADAVSGLAVLRAETGLRMPDCCVLQAATAANAETIATFDGRLARVAKARGLKTREVEASRCESGDDAEGARS